MTRFPLYLILCVCFMQTYAQNIERCIKLQDGSKMPNNYAILKEDICTFQLADKNTTGTVSWHLSIQNQHNIFETKFKQTSPDFTISPQSIDTNYWKLEAKRISIENDSSLYFKGSISVYIDNIKKDSMIVLFNLLPSCPKILGASFQYTSYNWEYDDFYPDFAQFNITFSSDRNSFVAIIYSGRSGFFEMPQNYFFNIRDYVHYSLPQDKCITITASSIADWGQFYEFQVANEYGTSLASETLCTTDYITDPLILKRLEELKQEASNIPKNNEEQTLLIMRHSEITYTGDKTKVLSIILYNNSGKIIKKQSNGDNMDISQLPKGFYIAACRIAATPSLLIVKFIKQ